MTFQIADRIRSRMQCNEAGPKRTWPVAPAAYYMRGTLGTKRELASVSSQGLQGIELVNEQTSIWTDGNASLQFVFARPRRIRWISIVLDTGPIPNLLAVSVNDGAPSKIPVMGQNVIRIRTNGNSRNGCLKLDIQSQTFALQAIHKTGMDSGRLGVKLTEVQFAKYWWRLPLNRISFAFVPSGLFSIVSSWSRRICYGD